MTFSNGHNDIFEQIYRAIMDNVCFDYSCMSKVSSGTKDYLESKATGQLQALFTTALHMDVEQGTLSELRALEGF